MWYVIQTITGKELETAGAIDKVLRVQAGKNCLPFKNYRESYKECFVIQWECVWRIEGRCRVHTEPLFPSYVFVETDRPDDFFFALKRVPKLTKLLGHEGTFWRVKKEEEKLLREMTGDDGNYVIRRSLVEVDSNGEIVSAVGALRNYMGKIVKKRLRKRVVMIEIPFLGDVKRVQLGVRMAGDEE